MKKFHFLLPIILILSIIGSFVGVVYNLKFKHDKLQGISENQLPLYEANQLVVDEKGNYYIGDGWYNKNIQIFDSDGNYKRTLSFPALSCKFNVDKNKLTIVSYGRSGNVEYAVDLDTIKIIEENIISDDEAEDLFAEHGKLAEKFYKVRNTTYELKRNFILYNKIKIIKDDKTKILILKNMPMFPLPTPIYLVTIVLLFWALALYTYVVLYFDKIKEKIKIKFTD